MSAWTVAVLGATAAHAGFQGTVTVLVYPALASVRTEDWTDLHDAHSRRITPLVALVYGALLVSCAGALVAAPGSPGVWVAAVGAASTFLVTATWAAPTHGLLAEGRTDPLVARLLRADRLRLVLAVVALVGAILAVSGA